MPTTAPTDSEIMAVLDLTATSSEQLCQRMRNLFAGVPRPPRLEEYQTEIREINEANGWFDSERSFGDDIALLHSEVSEMFEAYRDGGLDDMTQLPCDCQVSTAKVRGMHHSTECAIFKPAKPEGVGSEAADVLVRLLDTCERHGLDLRYELERKLAYNRTRGYRHGGKRV